jgi:RNase adaptor protein for sRNA GlmZ degradation
LTPFAIPDSNNDVSIPDIIINDNIEKEKEIIQELSDKQDEIITTEKKIDDIIIETEKKILTGKDGEQLTINVVGGGFSRKLNK